jgi:hypothetical protein
VCGIALEDVNTSAEAGMVLVAIDTRGKERWRCRLDAQVQDLLLDTRDRVRTIGRQVVRGNSATEGRAAPSRLYVINSDGRIERDVEIDRSGALMTVSAVDLVDTVYAVATAPGSTIASPGASHLIAFANDGRERWRRAAPAQCVFGTPSVGPTGRIFAPVYSESQNERPLLIVFSRDGDIVSQVRSSPSGVEYFLPPTVGADDGVCLVVNIRRRPGRSDGYALRSIDASGRARWTLPLAEHDLSMGVSADARGRLFATTKDGFLYAIE